jgi:ATP-dependent RNA helicase DeaD
MIDSASNKVQILVITPTRELATQVSDELFSLGKNSGVRTVTIYGGSSYSRQLGLIQKGASVVVATPGRMLDLLKNGRLPGFAPSIVILDEADEMLDMGFLEDIETIFSFMPEQRQTLLFSATMPEPIKRLAQRILKDPKYVSVTPKDHTTNEDIDQQYYVINEYERDHAMVRILDATDPEKAIVFCRTKKEVDRLSNLLSAVGYNAKCLHGDMEQNSRETVIKGFRASQFDILVATDVAARGLNVTDISHVFNFHMPFDPESYVHRIGRTGRAGKKGTAITLVTPNEYHSMQRIAKKVGSNLDHKLVPTIGDVNQRRLKKIADKIISAPINDDAQSLLNILEENMDMAQIALKLISVKLDKNAPQGPDKIGFDKQSLVSMIKRIGEKDRSKGNRRYGRNPRSSRDGGGSRGGSREGGGYRGGRDGGSRDGGGRSSGSRDGGGSRDSGGRSSSSRNASSERSSRRRRD